MVELVTNLCTSLPSAQGGRMRCFYLGTNPKCMFAGSSAGKCLSVACSKYLNAKCE